VTDSFLITCEHGGSRIPAPYRRLFLGQRALLDSHRGYDPGALVMANDLARAFTAPLVTSAISRLLIDLNRSIGHPQLFSTATRGASAKLRARIIEQHYLPYRAQVERLVRQSASRGRRVIHISSHSFTPELYGKVRHADVGLLYDPYAWKGDGLTSHLRQCFPSSAYVGIELEVNQSIVLAAGRRWVALRSALIDSLRTAWGSSVPR
jgi:predicted N-formylglutamate amidohydrolase